MTSASRSFKTWYVACLATLIVAGIAVHGFQRWMYRKSAGTLPVTLAKFPEELGEWRAVSVGLDEEIEAVLHLEDHWSASYAADRGRTASLLIGYYGDEAVAKLHQPTVCYPGAGWTVVRTERITLPTAGNPHEAMEVNRLVVERGEQRQIVLYWFHFPGATVAEPSLSKLHRIAQALQGELSRSLIKVQIASPAPDSPDAAMDDLMPFIRDVMAQLARHTGPEWGVPQIRLAHENPKEVAHRETAQ